MALKSVTKESDRKQLGKLLQQLRKESDYTQPYVKNILEQLLATKLGDSTISGHERGEREPGITFLKAYAQIYGVSLDTLCGMDDFGITTEDKVWIAKAKSLSHEAFEKILNEIDWHFTQENHRQT